MSAKLHILNRIVEHLASNGGIYTIFTGVHDKGISGGISAITGGGNIRIDGIHRPAGIVEIKAPMEEALNIVLIQQYTQNSCSVGGHCHKGIGIHALGLTAIIDPLILDLMGKEIVDAANYCHRALYQPFFVKDIVRKRIIGFAVSDQYPAYYTLFVQICSHSPPTHNSASPFVPPQSYDPSICSMIKASTPEAQPWQRE